MNQLCEVCNKYFTQSRPSHRYCTVRCRNTAERRRYRAKLKRQQEAMIKKEQELFSQIKETICSAPKLTDKLKLMQENWIKKNTVVKTEDNTKDLIAKPYTGKLLPINTLTKYDTVIGSHSHTSDEDTTRRDYGY